MGVFSKSFNPRSGLPDLTGKVIIVTGGDTGIGYSTVKFLARRGARIYIAARNEEKALAALNRLESDGTDPGNGEITWLNLNLDDHRKAKSAAEEFLDMEDRLDILINNAQWISGSHEKSVDGVADSMMVNHFSPFVFTQTLLPLLKQTAKEPESDVRIVNIASQAHAAIDPEQAHFRNLEDINQDFSEAKMPRYMCYAYSKLANILWTKKLQKQLDTEDANIIVTCVHPGNVNVFSEKLPLSIRSYGTFIMKHFFKTPDQGSYNLLIAAASADVRSKSDIYKGAYLEPVGKVGRPSKSACDEKLGEELWKTTETFLASVTPTSHT